MFTTRSIVTAFVLLLAAPSFAQEDNGLGKTVLPSKGLLWGSKITLEALPCCATPNGKLPDKAEAALLPKLTGHVSRDDTILKLGLDGERSLKITDCADETACEADRFRKHRLVAWWPETNTYVVNVLLYEGNLAYLVSEKDGRTTQVVAAPVLSPSGHHAVALESNLMAGMTLELIDMSVTPPKVTEIENMPTCAGFGADSFLRPKPVWVDDSHVRFEGVSPQPGDNPNNKQLLRIGTGAAQWEC